MEGTWIDWKLPREKKGSERTPWMCLPAVLAGFQAQSVTLSISALRWGDNGLSAPTVTLLPPPPQSVREKQRRGEEGWVQGVMLLIALYVYLGYDTHQNSVFFSPLSLLQFETGMWETGYREDRDPETLCYGETHTTHHNKDLSLHSISLYWKKQQQHNTDPVSFRWRHCPLQAIEAWRVTAPASGVTFYTRRAALSKQWNDLAITITYCPYSMAADLILDPVLTPLFADFLLQFFS